MTKADLVLEFLLRAIVRAPMLLTVLAIVGLSLIVLALVLNAARNAAMRRETRKRAELIRLRLQDQPDEKRAAYRKIEIRLSRS